MSFLTLEFFYLTLITTAGWYIFPPRYRWTVLLTAGYYFYYSWAPWYTLLLAVPTILVFYAGKYIAKGKRSLLLFAGGLTAGAGALIFYKIGGLFMDSLGKGGSSAAWIIPAGLSFFSFRLISYLTDVRNGVAEPESHFGHFALYVSFFPQLLAGPIERVSDFMPQLKKKISFDIDNVVAGTQLFAWGMFKKLVVSERLMPFVNRMFDDPEGKGLGLLFGAWFYYFVIYCDFSGYTDMAVGAAKVMGIKSVENFNYPYLSRSITQFWNRWHISLSTWLRDYLFLPISYAVMKKIDSGKLLNIKVETWSYVTGMSITMLLGGLWHGARWTFIAWGALHGIFLAVSFMTRKRRKKLVKKTGLKKYTRVHHAWNIVFTFNMITLSWIFFHAKTMKQAVNYLANMDLFIPASGVSHIVFNSFIILLFLLCEYFYRNRTELLLKFKRPDLIKSTVFAVFVCLLILLSVDAGNNFIYMQF